MNKPTTHIDRLGRECTRCRVYKTWDKFDRLTAQRTGYDPRCKECRKEIKRVSQEANPVPPEVRREYVRRYRKRHPDRIRTGDRRRMLRYKYGLTVEQYDRMSEEQQGLCAVCREPEKRVINGRAVSLAVDHDHATGAVRQLLCHDCNTTIGTMREDIGRLQAAIDYLRRWAQ